MDLANLTFRIADPLPVQKEAIKREVKDAEFVGLGEVCACCEVPGSKPLPDRSCSICGGTWADDTEDDFQVSLDLLTKCHLAISDILHTHRLAKKLSALQDTQLRDLAIAVDDFLDTYTNYLNE